MSKRYPIIGITGAARSGKDTVADFILAEQGGYRYGFADPIRDMLAAIGIDMSDPFWQAHKEEPIQVLGVSPRRMMQTLGTEWGREMVHPNLWVILASNKLMKLGAGMIISDVRFENEALWVRDLGGVIIHVQRDNASKVEPHASESGITFEEGDILLTNNGTLDELQQAVKEIIHGVDET
jgi:hypothetical protein